LRHWLTVGFERVVLVVARTVTALNRLLDILTLVERDPRIQVVFTTDPAHPAVFRRGVDRLLAELDAVTVPWAQAVAARFDLVVAASENDRLHQLSGPILLVPHGIGYQKYYPHERVVAGLNPARLVRDGAVVPSVIGVSHPGQADRLAVACPPAAARAVLIGDPAADRLLASRHRRTAYRAGLGGRGRRLVLLATTWGPDSLLGRFPRLPRQVAEALPVDEYRVLAVLHPGVWAAHGRWQVRAWLSTARDAGVHLVGPSDWQAALVAADTVLSDQGSLALYAASLDLPLLLIPGDAQHTVPDSPLARLAALATRLNVHGDLRRQLDACRTEHRPHRWDDIVADALHRQDDSAARLRTVLYRLLTLTEPAEPAAFPPSATPTGTQARPATIVAGTPDDREPLFVQRFPATDNGQPHIGLGYRHLVVDVTQAGGRHLAAASVIVTSADRQAPFARHADDLLAAWPDASVIAAAVDPVTCLVHTRADRFTVRAADPPDDFDPTLLASLAFVRLRQRRLTHGTDRLRLAERDLDVTVAPR
jgi:hypothetical protein